MRQLIMWNLVTLDGFFEGRKSWEIDWHEYVWGEELERFSVEQSKSIGMLLFGRVTYEGMAGYWSTQKGQIADFMNSIPKIVFSKTLESADWNNTRLVKGKPEEEVARLKKHLGKDLYIFGSANLSATLTEHGLIIPAWFRPGCPGRRKPIVQGQSESVETEACRSKAFEVRLRHPSLPA